ncbi:MAG: hypothetical protein LLG06_14300 [Desulfobacteraceae bacterium]|nr:hypothetical protein [Desulfobacteraceae bacterium]
MRRFCEEHGFRFHPVVALLFMDHALDYCEGRELAPEAQKTREMMLIDLETLIENGRKDHAKKCLLNRVLPVISWDMSVMPCCNYSYRKLADNFLDVSLEEIIRMRSGHPLCVQCQAHSLHRYFNPEMYSATVNELLQDHIAPGGSCGTGSGRFPEKAGNGGVRSLIS